MITLKTETKVKTIAALLSFPALYPKSCCATTVDSRMPGFHPAYIAIHKPPADHLQSSKTNEVRNDLDWGDLAEVCTT